MRASKELDPAPEEPADGPGSGPDIALRVDQVKTIMRLTGWTSAELARQMSMDQSAVTRLLDGRLQLGRKSMAGLLVAAYGQYGGDRTSLGDLFEELFEVRDAAGNVIPTGRKTGERTPPVTP